VRVPELIHEYAPYLSLPVLVVAYVIYSTVFRFLARRSGGDPVEVAVLIRISFVFLAVSIGYLVWQGWFNVYPRD
jgi:hypothetical protein